MLTSEQTELQKQLMSPITMEYINKQIIEKHNNKYLTICGYISYYDGGEKALHQDTILNYMHSKGYKLIRSESHHNHYYGYIYLFENYEMKGVDN